MKYPTIVGVILLLVHYGHTQVNAAPKSVFGFAEYEPYETPVPTAKLSVIYDTYVDVTVGNPGKTLRLRIDFSRDAALTLFSAPEDLSKEYSLYPHTLLVYLGPAFVRLTFTVDASLHDAHSVIKYDGILGFGHYSDIWKYWTHVSVSSHRLVLGEFDKTLSRATYNPFKLDFTRDEPVMYVRVDGQNFSLTYNPSDYYSTFPHILYHNITNFDLNFNQLQLEIDSNDIKMKLTSGFDRSLIKKNVNYDDLLIVLGQHFSHNFVLYYDIVNQTRHLMPAFDMFAVDHAEPLFSYVSLTLWFFLFVVWICLISTTPLKSEGLSKTINASIGDMQIEITPEEPLISPAIFTLIEFYVYIAATVALLLEVSGFAYYRHLAFMMSSTNITAYIVLNTMTMVTVLIGVLLAYNYTNSHKRLNVRRIFVETIITVLLWIMLSHWIHVMSTFVQVLVISIYCVIRGLQLCMAVIVGKKKVIFVSGCYFLLGLAFYVFYNLIPIIHFYFFGFNHAFTAGVIIFSFTIGVPLLAIVALYPLVLIRNSTLNLDRLHHLHIARRAVQRPSTQDPQWRLEFD